MPPQYRVGLNDPQRRAPLPPRAGEQDPEEPIPWTERQACPRARQHGQLLPKGQVLKGNRSVSAAHQTDRSENDDQRRQHTVSCRVFSDRINRGAGRSGCGEAQPVTTIPRLVTSTKLSVPGATAALERLVALELVREVTGRQRGRVYSYAPYVGLLSEGTEPLAK
jgi:hypothetical protein